MQLSNQSWSSSIIHKIRQIKSFQLMFKSNIPMGKCLFFEFHFLVTSPSACLICIGFPGCYVFLEFLYIIIITYYYYVFLPSSLQASQAEVDAVQAVISIWAITALITTFMMAWS